MPIDPGEVIGTIERTIGIVPAAGLAIIMLVGPTTVWLIWRLIVQPRTNRFAERGVDLLWICERCRSANEVRVSRCYSCGFDREAMSGDLHVLDGDGVVVLASDGSATVRSPGAATPAAVPSGNAMAMGTRPNEAPLEPASESRPPAPMQPVGPAPAPPRQMVPVGPGRPAATRSTKRGPRPPTPTADLTASNGHASTTPARRPRKPAVTVPPVDPPEA